MRTANLSGMDNYSLNDGIDGFRQALSAHGLHPDHIIVGGDKPRRFSVGDGKKNDAGWYLLNDSIPMVGFFGNWQTGESHTWFQKDRTKMSFDERKSARELMAREKARRNAEREKSAAECVEYVKQQWHNLKPAGVSNKYAKRKGIKPYEAREMPGDRLMILVRDADKNVTSAQYISADGGKLFAKGGKVGSSFFTLRAKSGPAESVLICEGYATACTLFDAMGGRSTIVAALSANNMLPVAKIVRGRFGADSKIIVCAEDDWQKENNVGLSSAREAAEKIGAALAIPEFGDERGEKDTDFNDMQRVAGLEAVHAVVNAAQPHHEERHEPTYADPEPIQHAPPVGARGAESCNPVQAGEAVEGTDRGEPDSSRGAQEEPPEFDRIPVEAYADEGNKEAEWIEPFEGAMETLFRIGIVKQHRPQPALTVAASLAAMSACLHGKYCLPDNLRSNLYIIGLAGSGSGKGEPLELVKSVIGIAGGIAYSKVGSGEGIERVLSDNEDRRAALTIDEVGHMIGAYSDKKAASHKSSIGEMLLTLYSDSKSFYTTRILANRDEAPKQIFNPHVTLYGTTTFAKMSTISSLLIEDGTLGRCLIMNGEDFVDQVDNIGEADYWGDIDAALGKHIRNLYKYGDKLMRPNGERLVIQISDKAAAMLSDLRQKFNDEAKASEDSRRVLLTRALEQVKRICLVLAAWDNEMGVETMVQPKHVEWAEKFVRHSLRCLLSFADLMTTNPVVEMAERVLAVMRDACDGKDPFKSRQDKRFNAIAAVDKMVAKNSILRKLKTDSNELNPAIKLLVERGEIEPILIPGDGGKRRGVQAYQFI